MKFNLHNKVFAPVSNSSNGEVNGHTLFHYQQKGKLIFATYEGGEIVHGQIIGTIHPLGHLDLRYQHVNAEQEIMTGKCHTVPHLLEDGRIRLYEQWQWTSGDQSKGESIVEELPKN